MIKVENVSKDYELADGTKVTALKNVSFEVKEGEKQNDKENEMPGASKAFKVVHIDITFGDSTREEIAVPVIRQNGKWRLQ